LSELELFSGLIIGFLGSLHCIGMCGPIVLALPSGSLKDKNYIFGKIIYNFGRVVTYSLLGLLFGFIGKGFALWGMQRWVSIYLGAMILIYILLPVNIKKSFLNISVFVYAMNYFKKLFGNVIRRKSKSSHFLIGLLNGLLPCGFVYVGIFASLALGDAVQGMMFMALFGIGTIPAMLGTSFAVNIIGNKLKHRIRLLIPFFASILAVIFIMRGLSLGIPYISPKMDMGKTEMKKDCCE
jgi:uncharacterized protein